MCIRHYGELHHAAIFLRVDTSSTSVVVMTANVRGVETRVLLSEKEAIHLSDQLERWVKRVERETVT